MIRQIQDFVKKIWLGSQDAVFPRFCVGCEGEGKLLCASCAVHWSTTLTIDGRHAYSMRYHDPLARDLLQAWKYHFDQQAWEYLQCALEKDMHALRTWVETLGIDFVVPVPLHVERFCERGFDQSVELAKFVARHLSLPCDLLLERRQATAKQADTPLHERKNILKKNPFYLRTPEMEKKTILLVDDVYTTGSTMRSAAQVLEKSADKIYFYTLAKG